MGCGPRGRAFAAAIASLDAADLVFCVDDQDPAAAPSWTDQALDTLIMAAPRPDSASLAAAVRDGLRVLVDPPLARGVVDARRAVRTFEGAPGQVGMGFDWRFEPLVQLLRVLTPRPLFVHMSMAVDPGPPQAPASVLDTVWTTPHHALDLLMHLFDRSAGGNRGRRRPPACDPARNRNVQRSPSGGRAGCRPLFRPRTPRRTHGCRRRRGP